MVVPVLPRPPSRYLAVNVAPPPAAILLGGDKVDDHVAARHADTGR